MAQPGCFHFTNQLIGVAFHFHRVFTLDHDANKGFGARGAQQHAATCTHLFFYPLHCGAHRLAFGDVWRSWYRNVFHDLGQLRHARTKFGQAST